MDEDEVAVGQTGFRGSDLVPVHGRKEIAKHLLMPVAFANVARTVRGAAASNGGH